MEAFKKKNWSAVFFEIQYATQICFFNVQNAILDMIYEYCWLFGLLAIPVGYFILLSFRRFSWLGRSIWAPAIQV